MTLLFLILLHPALSADSELSIVASELNSCIYHELLSGTKDVSKAQTNCNKDPKFALLKQKNIEVKIEVESSRQNFSLYRIIATKDNDKLTFRAVVAQGPLTSGCENKTEKEAKEIAIETVKQDGDSETSCVFDETDSGVTVYGKFDGFQRGADKKCHPICNTKKGEIWWIDACRKCTDREWTQDSLLQNRLSYDAKSLHANQTAATVRGSRYECLNEGGCTTFQESFIDVKRNRTLCLEKCSVGMSRSTDGKCALSLKSCDDAYSKWKSGLNWTGITTLHGNNFLMCNSIRLTSIANELKRETEEMLVKYKQSCIDLVTRSLPKGKLLDFLPSPHFTSYASMVVKECVPEDFKTTEHTSINIDFSKLKKEKPYEYQNLMNLPKLPLMMDYGP